MPVQPQFQAASSTPPDVGPYSQPMQEPRFLKENWKVILGSDCPEHLRFVRVLGGVANVTNGTVLIRFPLPHLPDGFYVINETGAISDANGSSPRWMNYPDTATCVPAFHRMKASGPFPAEVISELVSFVEFVRRQKTSDYGQNPTVVMTRGGLFMAHDPQVSFILNLQNLPTGNELTFSPFQLKVALVEMLRYTETYISQDDMGGGEGPIVFGKDWGHCALVQQRIANRYRSGVQYHH